MNTLLFIWVTKEYDMKINVLYNTNATESDSFRNAYYTNNVERFKTLVKTAVELNKNISIVTGNILIIACANDIITTIGNKKVAYSLFSIDDNNYVKLSDYDDFKRIVNSVL